MATLVARSSSKILRLLMSVRTLSLAHHLSSRGGKAYENIELQTVGVNKDIALVTFNRPAALNVITAALVRELKQALNDFEKNTVVGAVILTGKGKAFSAGADLDEFQDKRYADIVRSTFLQSLDCITTFSKPIIAAVHGTALAGGCEVAMMCDIVYAAENAEFSQPEVLIGLIPGAGRTQRLTRVVGKSKAMEMCLTGDMMTADEALQFGLVSKVVPNDQLLDESVKVASKIAANSKLINALCKEAINKGYNLTLDEGCHFERRLFHSTFATHDREEGMAAFIEKRKAVFKDK